MEYPLQYSQVLSRKEFVMNEQGLDSVRGEIIAQLDKSSGKSLFPEVHVARTKVIVFLYLVDTLRLFFKEFLVAYNSRTRRQ